MYWILDVKIDECINVCQSCIDACMCTCIDVKHVEMCKERMYVMCKNGSMSCIDECVKCMNV